MKFEKLQIEESITSKVGIKEINLERLGNVVALIGRNGSGKTRVLDLLENNFDKIIFREQNVKGNKADLLNNDENGSVHDDVIQNRAQLLNEIEKKKSLLNRNPNDQDAKIKLNKLQIELARLEGRDFDKDIIGNATNERKQSYKRFFRRIRHSDIKDLRDAAEHFQSKLTFEQLIEGVDVNFEYNEIDVLYHSSLSFSKKMPNQVFSDYVVCGTNRKKLEKKKSYLRFTVFKKIFEAFFRKTIEWEANANLSDSESDGSFVFKGNANWTISDRSFNYDEFSEGEKILFSYVLLFF
jgi:hypothetical protein